MSTSRKLAITQLVLFVVSFVLSIISLIIIFQSSIVGNLKGIIVGSGVMLFFNISIGLSVAIIGIIQIVFASKEQVGVLLASGICSIVGVIPFIGWPARIAAFVLNIIGVVKTKNL